MYNADSIILHVDLVIVITYDLGPVYKFTLRWRSALAGQEVQPKTWLFETREGMPEKMKRQ